MAEISAPRGAGHIRTTETGTEPAREPLWRHMLGHELRRLRHQRGETLQQTARRAGVSPQYLSEVERGTKEPSSELTAAIAGALEVGLADLTGAVTEALRERQPTGARTLGLTSAGAARREPVTSMDATALCLAA